MIVTALIISIISLLVGIFSIYSCIQFVKNLKTTDDTIIALDKKDDETRQIIMKAIKKELIDTDGSLRKSYEME